MAPFSQAIITTASSDANVYLGTVDGEWAVVAVPNGGYISGVVVNAAIAFQRTKQHPNVMHIVTHFLMTVDVAPFEIRIKVLREGKSLTNILADLVQKVDKNACIQLISQDKVRLACHLVFEDLRAQGSQSFDFPSNYRRQVPLYSHPSEAKLTDAIVRSVWKFMKHIRVADDPHTVAINSQNHSSRTAVDTVGGGGAKWAAWFEFVGQDECITPPALVFLSDVFQNAPMILMFAGVYKPHNRYEPPIITIAHM